mmetsp:Transcript_31386/g.93598  ORF Transcript_31386/g.93598 Transcript_31386/m.93598 type:complete len:289 (+) Transcript_31386:1650-2516(+)
MNRPESVSKRRPREPPPSRPSASERLLAASSLRPMARRATARRWSSSCAAACTRPLGPWPLSSLVAPSSSCSTSPNLSSRRSAAQRRRSISNRPDSGVPASASAWPKAKTAPGRSRASIASTPCRLQSGRAFALEGAVRAARERDVVAGRGRWCSARSSSTRCSQTARHVGICDRSKAEAGPPGCDCGRTALGWGRSSRCFRLLSPPPTVPTVPCERGVAVAGRGPASSVGPAASNKIGCEMVKRSPCARGRGWRWRVGREAFPEPQGLFATKPLRSGRSLGAAAGAA